MSLEITENIEVKRTLAVSKDEWEADPSARATIKLEIAEQIGRALHTRYLIDWSWKVDDNGLLEVTGVFKL